MGGVYTLGNHAGTRVCNNVIFNVLSYDYGGWGLYPDEGTEGLLMENNLVYDTSDGSFHQHYGKENMIRNNILAFSTPHQVAITRVEPHLSLTFENNIIYWDSTEAKAIGYQSDNAKVDYKSNLWYSVDADGKPGTVDFKGKTHAEWMANGRDAGSLVADPKFVDAKKRDFRLQPDSPALKMGFVPFDFSKAGVYGDESWVKRAVHDFVPPVHPHVPPPPKPLPFKLSDSFETERYSPVLKGVGSDEGKNLIRLSKENPASGEHCLEIVYAPGLEMPWNPHLYYVPNYDQGRVRIAFSLRMQENAEVDIELRDRSNPYKVGPRFRVTKGKLQLDGAEYTVSVNEWIRYELVTHVGEQSTESWTLRLILPKGTQEFKGLKFHHADWRSLNWFGFTSPAKSTERTTYYLDDMEIGNE
jgi:hypothetical protein